MKRTIKFRGKRIDNGEWVYGYVVFNTDGKAYIKNTNYNVNNGKIDIIPDEVHPESVGQFTQLHDKNGTEIYEGDVVTSPYNDLKSVVSYGLFCDDSNYPNAKSIGFKIEDNCGIGLDINGDMVIEVIGNIHEHSHLLK